MIPQFAGQRVCVVGQVMSQNGEVATLQCSAGQSVNVQMNPGSQYNTTFVEVVGIAGGDGSVREERACDMGNAFDLGNYDAVVSRSC